LYKNGDLGIFVGFNLSFLTDKVRFANTLMRGSFSELSAEQQMLSRPSITLYSHRKYTNRSERVRWAPNVERLGSLYVKIASIMVMWSLPLYSLLEVLDRLPFFAHHLNRSKKVRALARIFLAYEQRKAAQSISLPIK